MTLRAFAKNAAATPVGGVGEEVAPAMLVAGDFNTDPDSPQVAGVRTVPISDPGGSSSA